MPRIFISYRRADSRTFTDRIHDRLVDAFGEDNIFQDVDDIRAGEDFRVALQTAVNHCDVLLVVIGPKWAGISDTQGRKRLYNRADFVRIEVESGLKFGKVVIPVLIEGASVPAPNELPPSLRELIFRNAAIVRHNPDFKRDMERLITQIHSYEEELRRIEAERKEAQQKAEAEEAERLYRAELEAQRQAAEEAEIRRKSEAEEAERQRLAEIEAQQQAEAEETERQRLAELTAQRQAEAEKAELQHKADAELEEHQRLAEVEAQRKAQDEAANQQQAEAEETERQHLAELAAQRPENEEVEQQTDVATEVDSISEYGEIDHEFEDTLIESEDDDFRQRIFSRKDQIVEQYDASILKEEEQSWTAWMRPVLITTVLLAVTILSLIFLWNISSFEPTYSGDSLQRTATAIKLRNGTALVAEFTPEMTAADVTPFTREVTVESIVEPAFTPEVTVESIAEPAFTPEVTAEPIVTPFPTLVPTPDLTALAASVLPAVTESPDFGAFGMSLDNPVTQNSDWTPVIHEFAGVEMVLVPAGCFDMGQNGAGGRQCFDKPFWIDRLEVHGENKLPSYAKWFDAKAHCEQRGTKLPTEAQWEYAARGPSNLLYPWGQDFVASYAHSIFTAGFYLEITIVGSYPQGVSWVGALDFSGNIREWTSSRFMDYPYNTSDGRENFAPDKSQADPTDRRVIRGGASYDGSDKLTTIYRAGMLLASNIEGIRCARDFQPGDPLP